MLGVAIRDKKIIKTIHDHENVEEIVIIYDDKIII